MNIVDILLVIFILAFVTAGWKSGFVRAAGSFVAFILSVIAASYAMGWLHDSYGVSFTTHPWLTIVGFLVLVIIANKLTSLLVEALDLLRKAIAILPFVNLLNSFLGGIFGLLQAGIAVCVFAYIAITLFPSGNIRTSIASSLIVERIITIETGAGIL
ncbi:MAG: CvpA family protein [Patescibacteria group bacterium]|jgi:uncharacterized membrane protein required for colicin V production